MKNPTQTNLIDLREPALDRLGIVAERRMKVYTGRIYVTVEEIRVLEKRFKHLNSIDELFEFAAQSQEEVA